MKTVKNHGWVNVINKVGDGEGRRITSRLLNELFLAFVKQSGKYIRAVEEAPFAFKERQLHSIIAPALATLTDAFLMETPFSRKGDKRKRNYKKDYLGWLDYWAQYKGYEYFIEIKHGFDAYSTEYIRPREIDKWKTMNDDQLPMLKHEAIDRSKYCRGVFLISLHFVTIYKTMPQIQDESFSGDGSYMKSIQKRYLDNFEANWSGLWILNDELLNKCPAEYNTSVEYYPGVLAISNVSDLIR